MKHKFLDNSAKVVTVFIVIFVVLVGSSMLVLGFFFQKEIERRQTAEANLDLTRSRANQLENDLKEAKKQSFLLEEKNKEADERINSLMDELELQEALKAEMKNETASLKEQLAKEIQSKEQVRKELLDDLSKSEQKVVELEAQVKAAEARQQELIAQKNNSAESDEWNNGGQEYQSALKEVSTEENKEKQDSKDKKVELDKIVVVPNEVPQGRVLSIDNDTEFVIINLGEKDGVKPGDMMSILRGQEFLGDVKITRVQSEMSAADLIPPLSPKLLRKNDQVVLKQ